MKKNKPSITIVGVIIPVDWDDNGKPKAHALASYEEKEYLIDDRSKTGRDLLTLGRQKVRVTGKLGEVIKDRHVLTVDRFKVIT